MLTHIPAMSLTVLHTVEEKQATDCSAFACTVFQKRLSWSRVSLDAVLGLCQIVLDETHGIQTKY
jgi:hypothetical protein